MEKQRDKAAKRLERKQLRESGVDPDAEPDAAAEPGDGADAPDKATPPEETKPDPGKA